MFFQHFFQLVGYSVKVDYAESASAAVAMETERVPPPRNVNNNRLTSTSSMGERSFQETFNHPCLFKDTAGPDGHKQWLCICTWANIPTWENLTLLAISNSTHSVFKFQQGVKCSTTHLGTDVEQQNFTLKN